MKRRISVIPVLGLILLLGTVIMCVLIRPARDDFYYVTFCDEGLAEYLNNTIVHYREVTGRVFVHLILCPLLQLNMWPFRVFNMLLICVLGYLCTKLCDPEGRFSAIGFTAFLGLFWLMGASTLGDSVLWGAGSLNYLFPTTLIILYAWLFNRYLIRKNGGMWLIPIAFLSAATVEMTGILSLFVIVYFCAANKESLRGRLSFAGFNLLAALLGYGSLFTSAGVSARLELTGFASISLLDRINTNFAMFDRIICGPDGIWIITALVLLSSAAVMFSRGDVIASVITLFSVISVCLTGIGVIYDGIVLAIIAFTAFLILSFYGFRSYCAGDRIVPFCMLCITVSLGICLVSPVVGPRMVFPSTVFLILICLRNLLSLPSRSISAIVCTISVAAVLFLFGYIVLFAENAEVIDRNTERAVQCPPVGELVCTYVPNDGLVEGTVPSYPNFGGYYLEHMDIPSAALVCSDEKPVTMYYNGQELPRPAVIRSGRYYVPIRTAADVLNAEVKWELSTAVVITEQAKYCFRNGNYVANVDHGICRSVKLLDRVLSINSTIYISQRDFESLFSVQLSMAEQP